MRLGYILSGLACLLTGAYLDNSRGPMLPILNDAFGLTYSQSSWFLVGGYIASIIFTALLIPLSQKFDERQLGLFVLVLGLITPVVAGFATSLLTLLAVAALLGCAVSGLGSVSNLFVLKVALPGRRAGFLCFLHMMYGVGSFLAPVAVGWVAANGLPWMTPMWLVVPFLVAVLVFLLFVGRGAKQANAVEFQSARLNGVQWLVLAIFALYVAGEVMLSTWMVPFLVEKYGLEVEQATPYATGFFGVMALTRLLCFLGLRPRFERWVLWGCLPLALVGFGLGREGVLWGLSAAGVLGPFFPLFLGRVSDRFGTQVRPLTLWILTTMQVTLGINNFAMGRMSDAMGVAWSYWAPFWLLLGAVGLVGYYLVTESPGTANGAHS